MTESSSDVKLFIPHLDRTESHRVIRVDKFSHYVARQLGFEDVSSCCPPVFKLSMDYLKKSGGCEANIYEYFSHHDDPSGADQVFVKFCQEVENCILSYFAFHWNHASDIIAQVLREEEDKQEIKIKNFILAATRKQRFDRVTQNLKVTRVFSTLVEELKVIRAFEKAGQDGVCTEVMVPMKHSERSPVLLLMGGGMGAGKSTVLKDIMKQTFWASAGDNAIVVEADAFKESDVIYKALNSKGRHHDMLQTSELVHQSSTNAASSLLVTALNEGRDIIMDGTLSWVPFVDQTIEMVRNVHNHRYRMGVGYKVSPEDGTVTENYWDQVPDEEATEEERAQRAHRKPYRIELAGVVCDPYLAVVRGIRRAVIVGRAVRVKSQLQSHKMFAKAFPTYCPMVDNVRLYCTNAINGVPPTLIAWKEGKESKLLVDPEEIKCLTTLGNLNPDADNIYELYSDTTTLYETGSVWNDVLLSKERKSVQKEIKEAIGKIEEKHKKGGQLIN